MKEKYRQRIKLWVDALRSGDYQQCRNSLRIQQDNNNYNYCCLGVACAVYEKQTKKILSKDNWNSLQLPEQVAKWFNIERNDAIYYSDKSVNPIINENQLSATTANDIYKYDFSQISSIIEQTYLKDRK